MTTTHYIDRQGVDGQWRVWWLNPEGYTVERLFRTREAAEAWVDEIEAYDA